MTSSSPVPLARGSTRRSATVTNSVPEATIARSSARRLVAPPVPRISREPSSRPPSWNGSSIDHLSPPAAVPAPARRRASAAPGGDEHLDPVTLAQPGDRPGAAGYHGSVERDRHPAG